MTVQPGRASALERAAELVSSARTVCVLTGAGISTDSGIPDFRGPNGVWTRDPKAERYLDFGGLRPRSGAAGRVVAAPGGAPGVPAEPNAGHRALAELHRHGRLPVVLTQNIDGLHQRAGLAGRAVIELHGTVHETECLDCADRAPDGRGDRPRAAPARPIRRAWPAVAS